MLFPGRRRPAQPPQPVIQNPPPVVQNANNSDQEEEESESERDLESDEEEKEELKGEWELIDCLENKIKIIDNDSKIEKFDLEEPLLKSI